MSMLLHTKSRVEKDSFAEIAVVVQMSTVLPLYFLSVTGLSFVYTALRVCLYAFYAYNVYRIIRTHYIKQLICSLIIVGLLCLVNYLLYPTNRAAMLALLPDIVIQTLAFCNAYAIVNIKKLVAYLNKSAHFTFYLAMGFVVFIVARGANIDYIAFANGILFAAVFFLAEWFNGNKKASVYTLILAALLIGFCSRSSILYWSLAFVFLLIKKAQSTNSTKIAIIIIVLSLILIPLFLFWKDILIWLYYTLCDIGIDSRTLYMIIDGSIIDLNGRDEIYPLLIDKIRANPLLGYGIGSPNAFVVDYFFKWTGSINYIGSGAHNGVLACAVEFGVIIASLFVVFNARIVWRLIRYRLSQEDMIVFAMLLCSGVFRVIIGSTYWQVVPYAICIGLYIKRNKAGMKGNLV